MFYRNIIFILSKQIPMWPYSVYGKVCRDILYFWYNMFMSRHLKSSLQHNGSL